MKGKRGKDNEPRKVGMYLVKELCDLKLKEIAERFLDLKLWRGRLGWHGVTSSMEAGAKFRERVSSILVFREKQSPRHNVLSVADAGTYVGRSAISEVGARARSTSVGLFRSSRARVLIGFIAPILPSPASGEGIGNHLSRILWFRFTSDLNFHTIF